MLRFVGTLAVVVSIALAAVPPAVSAEAASPAALLEGVEIPHQKFVLDNGLTLIVHEDRKAPIVAVNVWYHVGSKNEKPGRTGFAHLFEHLMFNGSEHFDDDWFKAVEPLGASDLNGTTNNDRTNYFETVPTSALDRVLWLESDRMGHLLGALDRAKLDEQIGVVQNEKRQYENQPYTVSEELITKSVFPAGHPYSWTVIGSLEDLAAAELDDVHEWFKTYYGAANAVLVVAGDVDAQTVLEKVKRYFGDIPPGPPVARYESWPAKRTGIQRQVVADRVPAARLYKVWNAPAATASESADLELAADVLGSGKNSRLYERLVYREQIATDVSVYVDSREIASLFTVEVTAKPGQGLGPIEKAVDEEVAKLLASGPTASELARVQTKRAASFVRGIERIGGFGGKSDILAASEVFHGDPEAWKEEIGRLVSAGPDAVRGTASAWLSDGAYVLQVLPFADYEAAATGADRSKMPAVGAPPAAEFPEVERAKLSSGLEIVLAERRGVPVVNLQLLVDAGYAADRGGFAGTASLAMDLLDEGTTSRDALRIADEASRLGASLGTGADLDTCYVTLSALRANLDASLALFADIVRNPVFPEAEVERLRKERLAEIRQEKSQPIGMALRVFPVLLYGKDHAYGTPFTGSGYEDGIAKLGRKDFVRFHETWFKPNRATIVVSGDVSMAEIRPKLEAAFAGWKPGEPPAKKLGEVPPPTGTTIYLMDRPGSIQSVLLAGRLILPTSNPDEAAFQSLNYVLGGAFTSRLNMNLREDKHWTYGAGMFAPDAKGQRPYIAYAPVQTDKTKEALLEIRRELTEARSSRPATEAELANARSGQTLALAGEWETAAAVAGALSKMVRFGLPSDWYRTWPAKVRSVDAAAAARAAEKVLDPERMVWIVVGDRAKIEPGIRELGWGEVKLLDADGNPI
jgi:zinc protease